MLLRRWSRIGMTRRPLGQGCALSGSVVIVASLLSVSATHAATLNVSYGNGQLSVMADGVSLRDVLGEVARRAGLRIVGLESLTEPVTVSLGRMPLRQALRQLLRAVDHVVIEEGPARGGVGVSSVLIFGPKGQSDRPGSSGSIVEVPTGPIQPPPSPVLGDPSDTGELVERNATQYGMVAFPEEDEGERPDVSAPDPAR
jgi:hypothetical protein